MTDNAIGQITALLAALTWAFALIFFKLSGERVAPLAMSLFKNVIGVIMLAATLLITGEGCSQVSAFPVTDLYILGSSGFVGIALADLVLFRSLNLIGVSLFVIIDCAYSPTVLLLSWLFFAERLQPVHYLGGFLILFGMLISSRHAPPHNRTHRQLGTGILLGILSIVLMAMGIVMAKPVLEVDHFPLVWCTTIQLLAGTVALALIATASPERRMIWSVFRPASVWKYSVPASVLGGYLTMLFWVAGFKYTSATIAAVLNQTSVIFASILAIVILKEGLTRRKATAVGLALTGVLLVTLTPF